jgi:hypothetical protein
MVRKFYKEEENSTDVTKRTIWASEENETCDLRETGSHWKVVSGVRIIIPIIVVGELALVQ